MKKSSYTATHSGECQLCGHTQKLPGGGRLSLHGYTKQWGFFSGVCSGARGWPYETHTDLLAGEVKRQQGEIKRLTEWTQTIIENKAKNVWVKEYVPAYGREPSREEWRELTPADYTIKGTKYDKSTVERIEWTTLERKGNRTHAPKLAKLESYDIHTAEGLITNANEKKVAAINVFIKQRTDYVEWLNKRIKNWKLRPLTALAADEIGSKAATLHALNAYYSKKTGRDEALCGGGSHSMRGYTYKQIAKDQSKVTCKACLKALAATAADAALTVQADALVAEMVTKFGPTMLQQFSDASDKAIKEIRYQRKDLDKELRAKAIRIIERGVRS